MVQHKSLSWSSLPTWSKVLYLCTPRQPVQKREKKRVGGASTGVIWHCRLVSTYIIAHLHTSWRATSPESLACFVRNFLVKVPFLSWENVTLTGMHHISRLLEGVVLRSLHVSVSQTPLRSSDLSASFQKLTREGCWWNIPNTAPGEHPEHTEDMNLVNSG